MPTFHRVGDFTLQWGESVHWDDRRQRLYFVDCLANTVGWLDHGSERPVTVDVPSMPTGLVLSEKGSVVVVLDDGLHEIDPETGESELIAPNPDGISGRLNDAHVDRRGNLLTGTLGFTPDTQGSYWWYSPSLGWRQLDDGISNANGPLHVEIDGASTLLFGDTLAATIHRYPYDASAGAAGERAQFADTSPVGGFPDGSTLDANGDPWWAIVGASKIVRFDHAGSAAGVVDLPVDYPTSVAFGGPHLDTVYVTSISVAMGPIEPKAERAGELIAIGDLGFSGRPEPRFRTS